MNKKTDLNELLTMLDWPFDKLLHAAEKITADNFTDEVEFCSIVSAKTGACSEDCKYCAQSVHNNTNISAHPLLSLEEIKKCALEAKQNGAVRFSIVTSGKSPEEKDFPVLLEMIGVLKSISGITPCASLGILTEAQIKALKNSGVVRYHHNLNTCKSYHNQICSTHTYEERITTLELCKQYGMEICAGGIIGMGETRKQRVELACELAELQPNSVPVNFLHPIEGTPFAIHKASINSKEILRTLAIFRIAMPGAVIRYGGGRTMHLSPEEQELGIKIGVNGLLAGNYLTTVGSTPEEDKEMIARVGKKISSANIRADISR